MGPTGLVGSGAAGVGFKRVVMGRSSSRLSVCFESIPRLLAPFFGEVIWPLRMPGWRPKHRELPACRWQGGQRRTNISFARSGSGALVSAGFSTLASLVCPARNHFLVLPYFTHSISACFGAGYEKGDPFRGRLMR